MSKSAFAFIFARGGSKGLPRKNILPFAGKPLLAHAIATAQTVPSIKRILVSTDCEEIAETARAYGAEVPFMRPAELARDNAPEWLAWRHAIQETRAHYGEAAFDFFVSLPTTSPLRAAEDVQACLDRLLETDADIVITVTPAQRNPYFNMVTVDADGSARLVIPPKTGISGRQQAPVVFDMTTVAYVTRPCYIEEATGVFDGKVAAVCVPPERAIDIDTKLDFDIAEFLATQRSGL